MTMTIGIQESLRKIFIPVVVGGIRKDNPLLMDKKALYRECMPRFLATFTSNIFEDEYAFIYEVISTLKVKVFSTDQLRTVLNQNADLVLNSPFINLSKWSNTVDNRPSTDEEKVEAFSLNLMELFDEFSNDVVSEEEFNSSCEIYIAWFKEKFMLETSQNMSLIMSDLGFMGKKTHGRAQLYKGCDDVQKYYNERMKIIRELSVENRIISETIDAEWLEGELQKENVTDEDSIIDIGIEEIDEVVGKLRRSNMLGILGPPKGGKTRFSNYIVQRALSIGLNVVVWPLEGSQEEWIASQVSCMIRTNTGVQTDSKRILERKYENEDIKQLSIAAKTQMATDFKRGKLSFIKGTAYVEDFIDVMQQHYDNENAFDIIVIDQLINVLSRTGKAKNDRISEAYMLLKDFITNKLKKKALAILPCQLKQVVVDMLRAHPEDTIDVTAGGESAETIRSPDEVIGLFSTKEERNAGRMKIYSVASRHSGNFDDFYVRSELGCCFFYSDPSLNE